MRNLILAVAAISTLILGCNKNASDVPVNPVNEIKTGSAHLDSILNSTPYEAVSVEEENALLLMREEEKMARDLYINAFSAWNVKIFENISNSEQAHTDAIKGLLTKYAIQDPVTNDAVGYFTNPIIDSIYSLLNTNASVGSIEALQMGAFVEEFDINDLRVLQATVVDNQDITIIFENLERGSRNHLRNFYKNLQNNGVTYVPTILSQADFDAIVNSPQENGM